MNEQRGGSRREAVRAIEALNKAWLEGRPDQLSGLMHERMLIVDAAGRRLAEGREAAVESYRAFAEAAVVDRFSVGATQVDVFGQAAVVSYAFDIVYCMAGVHYREAGRDTFVLEQSDSGWLAVWRQTVSTPNPR